MGMIDEYFEFYKKYVSEYGENTAVLYCCGSFYEIYEISNEKENIGNAKVLSNILNMKFANKSGNTDNSSRSYPNFIGFTVSYLPKYLPVLLENNYTVVIVDQLEESSKKIGKTVRRGVTAIHSPALQPPDLEAYNQENNLVNVMIEILPKMPRKLVQTVLCSVICINNSTNEIEICEKDFVFTPNKFENCLDDINRIVKRYSPREIIVKCIDTNEFSSIKRYFDQNYSICKTEIIYTNTEIYKNYIKLDFQNQYLGNVYKHINFGLLQPIEYLKLEQYPLSILNYIFTLDFIGKHDLKYITNLNVPKIVKESNNLILELDTLRQLKIIDGNGTRNKPESVFDVIDFTLTHIGKRHLKSILIKPFKDHSVIEKRYRLTEEYSTIDYIKIENLLKDISDFERLHRKMGLEMLHPYEFEQLDSNYLKILEIIYLIKSTKNTKSNLIEICPNQESLKQFNNYIADYKCIFNLNIMKEHNLNSNKDTSHYFNRGQIIEIDTIQQNIVDTEKEIEAIRQYLDGLINTKTDTPYIKLAYNDTENYHFICTKIRFQSLVQKIKDNKFISRQTSNTCKFVTPELTNLSNDLINNRTLLNKKVKLHYITKLREYFSKYNKVFEDLKCFIEVLDITNSNLKCSKKYNYCRPKVINGDSSFIKFTNLRHPIIERLNVKYIPNDITLDNNTLGMLLYALNSAGKSSMLRSIGINLILAQAGLYVSCQSLEFSPFSTVISQIDFCDDFQHSSFIMEMIGLKKILECSGKNTLCLVDELLRSTENNSSAALVASTILELLKTSTKFFFTSHLHSMADIKEIKTNKKLQICHLSISIKNNNIIFDRKLQKGSGSPLYGIEVASNLLESPDLIDKAYEIRNKLTNNKTSILSTKKSVYNAKVLVNKCQICGLTKALESDHIIPQSKANDKGFTPEGFHKNEAYNIAILCNSCHLMKTQGKISIFGYKDSTKGKFLDYVIH